MKKQKPSTFILNANDVAYFFVEGKNSSKYGPIYCVYHDLKEKPVRYSAKNFVEVHGLNDKISIINFTKNALLDLTVLHGYSSNVDKAYKIFSSVYSTVKGQDRKSPSLGKLKTPFVEAISIYNDMIDLLPSKIDISYEEDYDVISDSEAKEKHKIKKVDKPSISSERKKVKQILTGPEDVKGVQRKLKYD